MLNWLIAWFVVVLDFVSVCRLDFSRDSKKGLFYILDFSINLPTFLSRTFILLVGARSSYIDSGKSP